MKLKTFGGFLVCLSAVLMATVAQAGIRNFNWLGAKVVGNTNKPPLKGAVTLRPGGVTTTTTTPPDPLICYPYVYNGVDDTWAGNLFVADTCSQERIQVTHIGGDRPVYTMAVHQNPNGVTIAYPDSSAYSIQLLNRTTGESTEVPIVRNEVGYVGEIVAFPGAIDFTPDGRIVLSEFLQGSDENTFIRVGENDVYRVMKMPDLAPVNMDIAYSPISDATDPYYNKIIVSASASSYRLSTPSMPPLLKVVDAETGAVYPLTDDNTSADPMPGYSPSISLDGRKLVFLRENHIWTCDLSFDEHPSRGSFYSCRNTTQLPLELGENVIVHPSWSWDSRKIFFSQAGSAWNMYIVNPDGSHLQPIRSESYSREGFHDSSYNVPYALSLPPTMAPIRVDSLKNNQAPLRMVPLIH